jgi:hypothetical protein
VPDEARVEVVDEMRRGHAGGAGGLAAATGAINPC